MASPRDFPVQFLTLYAAWAYASVFQTCGSFRSTRWSFPKSTIFFFDSTDFGFSSQFWRWQNDLIVSVQLKFVQLKILNKELKQQIFFIDVAAKMLKHGNINGEWICISVDRGPIQRIKQTWKVKITLPSPALVIATPEMPFLLLAFYSSSPLFLRSASYPTLHLHRLFFPAFLVDFFFWFVVFRSPKILFELKFYFKGWWANTWISNDRKRWYGSSNSWKNGKIVIKVTWKPQDIKEAGKMWKVYTSKALDMQAIITNNLAYSTSFSPVSDSLPLPLPGSSSSWTENSFWASPPWDLQPPFTQTTPFFYDHPLSDSDQGRLGLPNKPPYHMFSIIPPLLWCLSRTKKNDNSIRGWLDMVRDSKLWAR